MIATFINTIGLIIAFGLICIECNIGKKVVENTYSFKYEGRYIYDPEMLAKREKITAIVSFVNFVVIVINIILAIWVTE
jgi:hypothetical protein